jgi:hypothetical protein
MEAILSPITVPMPVSRWLVGSTDSGQRRASRKGNFSCVLNNVVEAYCASDAEGDWGIIRKSRPSLLVVACLGIFVSSPSRKTEWQTCEPLDSVRKQLITADHMNYASVAFDDSVHILAAGFMHLRVLPERLEYMYGILPTVPIADQAVARRIAETLGKENIYGDVTASAKARAVQQFYQYLLSQQGTLRMRDVQNGDRNSGAAYVLKKISASLQHYFSRGSALPDSRDILDF